MTNPSVPLHNPYNTDDIIPYNPFKESRLIPHMVPWSSRVVKGIQKASFGESRIEGQCKAV